MTSCTCQVSGRVIRGPCVYKSYIRLIVSTNKFDEADGTDKKLSPSKWQSNLQQGVEVKLNFVVSALLIIN